MELFKGQMCPRILANQILAMCILYGGLADETVQAKESKLYGEWKSVTE